MLPLTYFVVKINCWSQKSCLYQILFVRIGDRRWTGNGPQPKHFKRWIMLQNSRLQAVFLSTKFHLCFLIPQSLQHKNKIGWIFSSKKKKRQGGFGWELFNGFEESNTYCRMNRIKSPLGFYSFRRFSNFLILYMNVKWFYSYFHFYDMMGFIHGKVAIEHISGMMYTQYICRQNLITVPHSHVVC